MNIEHKFGLNPSPPSVRDFDFDVCCGTKVIGVTELPKRFEIPIDKWVKVYDQLNVNACVGFALAQAQEAHHAKITGESVSYSPGVIYGAEACRSGYKGEGLFLQTAMKGVTKIGFVPSSIFNIVEEMPKMKQIVDKRPDLIEIGSERKLKGFVNLKYALESKKIESMKQALYTYQVPLVVASYDYFGGAHCILIYGWDDDLRIKGYAKNDITFLLRNSWGKEYGNNGNYYIPVSQLDEIFLPVFEEFELPFTDVETTDWYYDEVLKAVFSGLMKGVSKTEFAPQNNIIRGDTAITIKRLLRKLQVSVNAFAKTLGQKGKIFNQIVLKEVNNVTCFSDVLKDDYYHNAINMVCVNGIMNGTADGIFEPTRPLTRAEMATIIIRTLSYIVELINKAVPSAKLELSYSDAKFFSDVLEEDWYYQYITQVTQIGLMQGDDSGYFRPNEYIIRAEAATVFNRLFKTVDGMLIQLGE